MWLYLIKAKIYNDLIIKNETHFHMIRAQKFSEATTQMEEFYGNDLEKIEIICLEDNYGEISEDTYMNILLDIPFEKTQEDQEV